MREKSQKVLEFYLFSSGALLMGYGLRMNYFGDSIFQVVVPWFAGVFVFVLPWLLFGDRYNFAGKIKNLFTELK